MLVLSRKVGENILIGDDIEVVVDRIDCGSVRIAISAPREVPVFRGELYEEIKRSEAAAEPKPRHVQSPSTSAP